MTKGARPVIGWREWVELPEWGLRILAKVDTGARSSTIDVARVETLPDGRIRFFVRRKRISHELTALEADLVGVTRVRSSNGISQTRYVVQTDLVMAGVTKQIRITLGCRKSMLHRMLLGREALAHDFLIDAALDHRPQKRRKRAARKPVT